MESEDKTYNEYGSRCVPDRASWVIYKMRIDKNDPSEAYVDFWDWITRSRHIVLILSAVISYLVYLLTTEEA